MPDDEDRRRRLVDRLGEFRDGGDIDLPELLERQVRQILGPGGLRRVREGDGRTPDPKTAARLSFPNGPPASQAPKLSKTSVAPESATTPPAGGEPLILQLDLVDPPASLRRRRAGDVVHPAKRRLAGLMNLLAGLEPAVDDHRDVDIE